ncbi:MAG: cation:proton antiporter [Steroidobacteraceae bacterium]
MSYLAILVASLFLLIAFAVEHVDRTSGLPSVIVMIVLGLVAKFAVSSIGLLVEGISAVVPLAGAVAFVLIVLEGALDIELSRERLKPALTAFALAAFALLFYGAVFAAIAARVLTLTYLQGAILATPLALISSSVAIPGSRSLAAEAREFVVYESSTSDILGVLVFFALVHSDSTLHGFLTELAGGGILSLLLAVACSLALVAISTRATAHVRYIPLLAGLFALYAAGQLLHLSPLIMVLLFGLMLNNRVTLARIPGFTRMAEKISPQTVGEFKVLVQELTFAVRGFFFFLLGYTTNPADFGSVRSWAAAALILIIIYGARYAMLRPLGRSFAATLTWIAPRGLITAVLYLDARRLLHLPAYMDGAVLLVVFLSAGALALTPRRRPSEAPPASI